MCKELKRVNESFLNSQRNQKTSPLPNDYANCIKCLSHLVRTTTESSTMVWMKYILILLWMQDKAWTKTYRFKGLSTFAAVTKGCGWALVTMPACNNGRQQWGWGESWGGFRISARGGSSQENRPVIDSLTLEPPYPGSAIPADRWFCMQRNGEKSLGWCCRISITSFSTFKHIWWARCIIDDKADVWRPCYYHWQEKNEIKKKVFRFCFGQFWVCILRIE